MTGRRSQSLAQLERDAALTRVSRTRRWILAAAAALTAVIAAFVSAIAPGRSLGAKSRVGSVSTASSAGAAPSTSSGKQMPPLASPGDLGLQGPSETPQSAPSQSQAAPAPAPAPAPQQAPVVSGGS